MDGFNLFFGWFGWFILKDSITGRSFSFLYSFFDSLGEVFLTDSSSSSLFWRYVLNSSLSIFGFAFSVSSSEDSGEVRTIMEDFCFFIYYRYR